MDLSNAIRQFYKKGTDLTYFEGLTPLHVAAGTGQLILYQMVGEKTNERQPRDISGKVPLYYAAQNGHFEICEDIIMESFKDKNPADNYGSTPLHVAAKNGHIKICHLIMENLDNKSPQDINGWTPLHRAAQYGNV